MAKYIYKKQNGLAPAAPAAQAPAHPAAPRRARVAANPPPPRRTAQGSHTAARRGGAAGRVLALLACWLLAAAAIAGLFLLRGSLPALAEEEPTPSHYPPLEKHQRGSQITIVLDAGHGGEDPGAVDPYDDSVWEKTITQTMVDRVRALLERQPDQFQVLQAVAPDASATPLTRAHTAIEAEADLFLSLHLNADFYPYYGRGFSVFPSPPGRVYYPESARFAQLLVERVRATALPVMGENGIFYHYYNQQSSGGFSKEIVDSADQESPRAEESFGVVEYTGCPAALIEQWFISSTEDMALMNNDAGYDTMARCIYLAVCDYFEIEPLEE